MEPVELRLETGIAATAGTPEAEPPVFVTADRIEGVAEKRVEATGDAELIRGTQRVDAERLVYLPATSEVTAEGDVKLRQDNDRVTASHMTMNLDTGRGGADETTFYLEHKDKQPKARRAVGDDAQADRVRKAPFSRGTAQHVDFEDKQTYQFSRATYSTCPAEQEDWRLKVDDLRIDRAANSGVARGARLEFMDVPVLYSPYMDFPLSRDRKSGFLAPIFGNTSTGGFDFTLPYYWNIAPNQDATIAPRLLTRRGVMLNTDYRYLWPSLAGNLRGSYLPHDQAADRDRWAYAVQHDQNFGYGFSGNVNLNGVSDSNFFRDLANQVTATSQTLLPKQGTLAWGTTSQRGGAATVSAFVQKFQVLQDPAAPVLPPYFRQPQLGVDASQLDFHGTDVFFTGSYVDFEHPFLVSGRRTVVNPSASYPIMTPFGYVLPKFGVHYTHYDLDQGTTTLPLSSTRTLPMFSVDSGMTFEREVGLGGRNFVQTLEPRVFYTYIPFKDQSQLPNFDTAEADFNFAQLFMENRFVGQDRINDANKITLALTSRIIDPETGADRLQVGVGQRFNFERQKVFLVGGGAAIGNVAAGAGTGGNTSDSRSDFLMLVSGNLMPGLNVYAGWDYNPVDNFTEKLDVATRWQPAPGQALNFGYRYTRQQLEEIDVSGQTSFGGRWSGVAKWNYSLLDDRLLEAILGVEYNAGCWTVRAVAQRFATSATTSQNSFFLQIELAGLAAFGPNPLPVLRQHVPGYTRPVPFDGSAGNP